MSQLINGKFVQSLPTVEGESQRGHWIRGGFVIEYGDEYPRKAAFSTFGEDKVKMSENIPAGTMVQVKFMPESREYEGKWYTENRAINLSPFGQQPGMPVQPVAAPPVAGQQQAVQFPANFQQQPAAAAPVQMPEGKDDLPF